MLMLRFAGPLPNVTVSKLKNFSLVATPPLSDQFCVVFTSQVLPFVAAPPVQVSDFELPTTESIRLLPTMLSENVERVPLGAFSVGADPVSAPAVSSV